MKQFRFSKITKNVSKLINTIDTLRKQNSFYTTTAQRPNKPKESGISTQKISGAKSPYADVEKTGTKSGHNSSHISETAGIDGIAKHQEKSDYDVDAGIRHNTGDNNPNRPTFFKKTWFIVIMLFFISPIGIFLMWIYKEWNVIIKILISLLFIFYFSVYCGAFV
mgnify:FL=1